MKKILLILLAFVCATSADAFRRPRFKPFEIENLEPKPSFWQVRPDEVIKVCKAVKNGRAEVVAKTPLGYPVYAVFFGDFSEPAPQTNWSAGNSSSCPVSIWTVASSAPTTSGASPMRFSGPRPRVGGKTAP